jgi:hypothetical protein
LPKQRRGDNIKKYSLQPHKNLSKNSTIAISKENWEALAKLGSKRETFDDIITRLLKEKK